VCRRKATIAAPLASAIATLALAGCGNSSNQASSEPSGNFQVDVATASFPAQQRLAEHSDMVIVVRNAGDKPIPDIAVTITDANAGTGAQPFAEDLNQPGLASQSRAVWIVDQAPCPATAPDITASGECAPLDNGTRQTGGPGGAVTAYANTWAMGTLAAGKTATFRWGVTAEKSGTHVIHYRIAAGLNGKATAVYAGGRPLNGTFVVKITSSAPGAYVTDGGQVINTPPVVNTP
jgi:hypothetical protein